MNDDYDFWDNHRYADLNYPRFAYAKDYQAHIIDRYANEILCELDETILASIFELINPPTKIFSEPFRFLASLQDVAE